MKDLESVGYIDVIGANSMLGDATVKASKKHGWEVAGTVHKEQENAEGIILRHLDMTDYEEVKEVVGQGYKKRKAIFIASAITNPREAKGDPEKARRTNVGGVENFFKAYLNLGISQDYWPKFILFGSVLEYALKEGGIKETDPLVENGDEYITGKKLLANIQSHYSKLGFNITRAIINRSSGEKQPAGFFVPDTAMKLARMKHSDGPKKLITWNTDSYQDYQYSGKHGEQLILTLNSGPNETINICSGEAVQLSFIVRKLIEASGLKEVEHIIDPEHNTPPVFSKVWGDDTKIRKLGSKKENTIKEMCIKAFQGREAQLLMEISDMEKGLK